MKDYISKLLQKASLLRNVMVLASGAIAGRAIIVLASPLLTRLYLPEDFGIMAVFASLLGILVVISSLRYHFAVPLPESNTEAASIVILCACIVLLVTCLTAAGVLTYSANLAEALQLPELQHYLWLLPLALLLAGVFQVLNLWAIREGAFKPIAKAKFNQALAMTAVHIVAFPLGALGLLLGKVAQQGVGIGVLGDYTLRKRWDDIRGATVKSVLAVASRHARFPVFSLWGGLANKIGSELPALAFAAFFGPATAGYYALANRVCALPTSLVGRAVADAFYSDAAEQARGGTLGALVQQVHDRLALVALPPMVTLYCVAPELFSLVFGANWRESGEVARWLIPMLYAQFVVTPLMRSLMAIGEQAVDAALQFLMVFVRVSSIALGVAIDSFAAAVIAYSISSLLVYAIYYVMILVKCDIPASTFIRASGRAVLVALPLNAPVLYALYITSDGLHISAAAFLTFSLIAMYYWHLLNQGK